AAMRELERRVVLQVLDRRWRDHLYEMDYLKDGIGLRAMAQRDPLIEYQREGYEMFQTMMGQIKEESVGFLFNLEVEVRRPDGEHTEVEAKGLVAPAVEAQRLEYTAPSEDGEAEVRNERGQVQKAATGRARQATAPQAPTRTAEPAARGAFGQRTEAAEAPAAAANNRAQRRAKKK
ncbi:MAG: preprotein translocase subunit SecA, partial [Microbacterium sp.]|nr:preprotein translocase subunit SecA [Microbacterium sp.]